MAKFDTYRKRMMERIESIMGESATWGVETALVLFNAPTSHDDLAKIDYQRDRYLMEYKAEVFIGLKALVDAGSDQTVTIDGQDYVIRQIDAVYDGKLFKAVMEKVIV